MRAQSIAVGNNRIERNHFVFVGAQARDGDPAGFDGLDLTVTNEFNAQFGREFCQGQGYRTRAAERVPDTFAGLHVSNAA